MVTKVQKSVHWHTFLLQLRYSLQVMPRACNEGIPAASRGCCARKLVVSKYEITKNHTVREVFTLALHLKMYSASNKLGQEVGGRLLLWEWRHLCLWKWLPRDRHRTSPRAEENKFCNTKAVPLFTSSRELWKLAREWHYINLIFEQIKCIYSLYCYRPHHNFIMR